MKFDKKSLKVWITFDKFMKNYVQVKRFSSFDLNTQVLSGYLTKSQSEAWEQISILEVNCINNTLSCR